MNALDIHFCEPVLSVSVFSSVDEGMCFRNAEQLKQEEFFSSFLGRRYWECRKRFIFPESND